jgi:hypothetical protein
MCYAQAMLTDTDIAWFAGLFEGEGCITIDKRNTGGRLLITMSDKDTIDHVNRLFPCLGIKTTYPANPKHGPYYTWKLNDPQKMRHIVNLILPYLGKRRTKKAEEFLAHIGSGPGRGHRSVTHCTRGHEFTPENTYIHPNGKRNCRTCLRAYKKARRANGLRD